MSALLVPPPPPKWVLDLNSPPSVKAKSTSIPDPPGYTAAAVVSSKRGTSASNKQQVQAPVRKAPTSDELDTLKVKKAWELAIAPAKQLPMSAIGLYMTGNSLQIFSIFMLYQLFSGPIRAIMNINPTFSRLESNNTKTAMVGVKIVYVLMNILTLSMGLYKLNSMGLLPTTRSDWLAWETQVMPAERAYPAYEV